MESTSAKWTDGKISRHMVKSEGRWIYFASRSEVKLEHLVEVRTAANHALQTRSLWNFTTPWELDNKPPLNSTPSHSFGKRIIHMRLLLAVLWTNLHWQFELWIDIPFIGPLYFFSEYLYIWNFMWNALCRSTYKEPRAQESQINKENIKSEGCAIVFNHVVSLWWSLRVKDTIGVTWVTQMVTVCSPSLRSRFVTKCRGTPSNLEAKNLATSIHLTAIYSGWQPCYEKPLRS